MDMFKGIEHDILKDMFKELNKLRNSNNIVVLNLNEIINLNLVRRQRCFLKIGCASLKRELNYLGKFMPSDENTEIEQMAKYYGLFWSSKFKDFSEEEEEYIQRERYGKYIFSLFAKWKIPIKPNWENGTFMDGLFSDYSVSISINEAISKKYVCSAGALTLHPASGKKMTKLRLRIFSHQPYKDFDVYRCDYPIIKFKSWDGVREFINFLKSSPMIPNSLFCFAGSVKWYSNFIQDDKWNNVNE